MRAFDKDWTRAEELRAQFMPLEDLRDGWEPARVLHHATELAGIAPTGPIPPYTSPLGSSSCTSLRRLRGSSESATHCSRFHRLGNRRVRG